MEKMKRIKITLTILVVIGVVGIGIKIWYVQLNIPKTNISSPADVSSMDVKQQIKRLYSQDPKKRADAAYLLGKMGKQAVFAIPFLIEMLGDTTFIPLKVEGGGQTSPAQEASSALGKMGKPAVKLLIVVLKDNNHDVRANAVAALVKTVENNPLCGTAEVLITGAIEPLIVTLRDENPKVREKAALALGIFGDSRMLDYIEDPKIREKVAEIQRKLNQRVVESLVVALKDENWSVRMNAAEALKGITGKDFGEDHEKWQKWLEKNKKVIHNGRQKN
jgi:HEAT repeat protein